jgi:hypothetical protein
MLYLRLRPKDLTGHYTFGAFALQNAHQVVDEELDMLEDSITRRHRQRTQMCRGENAATNEDSLFHL